MRTVLWAALVAFFMSMAGSPASAQVANYDASKVWGTQSCGATLCGMQDSANGHAANGLAAGQVRDTNRGVLSNTVSQQTIFAVGVYNQNTISGDNNNLNSNQNGNSNGNITTTGVNSAGNSNKNSN